MPLTSDPLLFDLHRHLGGCVTPKTVWKLIQHNKQYKLASTLDDVKKMMTFQEDEEYGFYQFLNKFDILNAIKWDEDSINLMISDVVGDLKKENLDYAEIHFSIDKYMSHLSWDEVDVCLFIIDRFRHWCNSYIMPVGLVLSLKYGSPRAEQLRVQKVIDSWQVAEHLVGLDVVGDESHFAIDFYEPIFRHWRLSGKGLTIHAGESVEPTRGVENVRNAITKLKVDRIAHGIHCTLDNDTIKLAKDYDVSFDIAFTSNLKTKIVSSIETHPAIEMYNNGCRINIGTDDPAILNTNILNEYKIAHKWLIGNGNDQDLHKLKGNSIYSSFAQYGPSWLKKLIKTREEFSLGMSPIR